MAPNLSSKSNKRLNRDKSTKDVKRQLLKFRKYIEQNCKNVGDNFAKEARNIHYDKKNSKGIYGTATKKETMELQEEGIEVDTIPWIDKSEN